MKDLVSSSFRFLVVVTLFFGGVYTLAITEIGQLMFPEEAKGSLIENKDGEVIGSVLVGQQIKEEAYFHGRASEVTQLSPVSAQQAEKIEERRQNTVKINQLNQDVPIDLVTASGSGVDPPITEESAHLQVARISEVRKINKEKIYDIIAEYTIKEVFSNRKYVNVLQMNVALDQL